MGWEQGPQVFCWPKAQALSHAMTHETAPANTLQANSPAFSRQEFRTALGMFATGVTIVTARSASGELLGLTASSFNSVSLEPPLVLWSLGRSAASMAALSTGSHYAINILAADQKGLAERFAGKRDDRWQGWTSLLALAVRPCWPARPQVLNALTAVATRRATTSSLWAKSNAASSVRVPRPCSITAASSTPSIRSEQSLGGRPRSAPGRWLFLGQDRIGGHQVRL
jgi:hypothetical protein